jgi:hypothetical protein
MKTKNKTNESEKNSINNYNNKLQSAYINVKKSIYTSFLIIILDIFTIFIFPTIFQCFIHILIITIIIILSILCLFVFRYNFMHASFNIYSQSFKVLIMESIILGIFYFDMIYILITNFLLDFDQILYFFHKSYYHIFLIIISFTLYLILNLSYPIFIIYKIVEVRKKIKSIGAQKDEQYDNVPNVELPVEIK